MGGKIWLESEKGRGSTFFFTCRYKKGAPDLIDRQKSSEDAEIVSLPPMRILLVEDNAFNLELAQTVLEQEGHQVTTAVNGFAALTELTKERFQVILMDVQMPELDGIETTRIIRQCENGVEVVHHDHSHDDLFARLRRNLHGTKTPIVAMTANAMSEDRAKCIIAGMDDYVTKPFEPKTVFRVIAQVSGLGIYPKDQADISALGDNQTTAEKRTGSRRPLVISEVRSHLASTRKLPIDQAEAMLQLTGRTLEAEREKAETALARRDIPALSLAVCTIKEALRDIDLHDWADLAHKIELRHARADETLIDGLREQLTVLLTGLAPLHDMAVIPIADR
jgi:CheY-like chemotaxis protein